jgi:DsbC/DsbD-like thiol-disulfide interchange protein
MKTSKTTKAKNATPKAPTSATKTAALDLPPAKKRTANVAAPVPAAAKPAAPVASVPARVVPHREVTPDQIAARAFVLWEQRGRPHGQDLETWLQAERQLKEEIQSFTA